MLSMQRRIGPEPQQCGVNRVTSAQLIACRRGGLQIRQESRQSCYAYANRQTAVIQDEDVISQDVFQDNELNCVSLSRRRLLSLLPLSLWIPSHSAQAYVDPTTPDPATACCDDVAFLKHIDEERVFSCLVPVGWAQVNKLDRSGGILGSWFNPYEPGVETLAIYRTPVPGIRDTLGLGTAEDQGRALASVAPNSLLLGYEEYQDDDGKQYYTCCVEFDGSSAGRFGSVVEFRNVCAKDGYKYTLRITTTRYRYLSFQPVKEELQRVVQSYRLLI